MSLTVPSAVLKLRNFGSAVPFGNGGLFNCRVGNSVLSTFGAMVESLGSALISDTFRKAGKGCIAGIVGAGVVSTGV